MATLVTNSLTHSLSPVDLIDVSLACEDAILTFHQTVTVADVEAKKRVDDSLVQIWKLKFGHKFECSDFEQKFWSRF